MNAARYIVMTVGLLSAATSYVHGQQPIKLGTKVGVADASGYDSGGRRDPFASLIVERTAGVDPDEGPRAKGLAGVSAIDIVVTGIMASGQTYLAILAGPDGAMYIARANDRLHDAVIRRIDKDAVVLLAKVRNDVGDLESKEVRKALRPTAGGGQ